MLEVKKFEAQWCGPCKALKPIFENVSNKFGNEVNFSYIDIDEQFEIAQQYHVRSVPTVIIEKNGEFYISPNPTYIPKFAVAPIFPRKAQKQRLNGYVITNFSQRQDQ